MNPIIHTEALEIGYHDKIVASGINMSIMPGTLVSVVGANGVGKSTLLRSLSAIQPALSGNIALNGKALSAYSTAALAREIALVLTERPPARNLTVGELVALGRQPYTDWIGTMDAQDRAITASALEMTGIGKLAPRRIGELSDGQMQKVMIARALAQDTPVIILDEPSTHLDLMHKLSLFRLLRKLANQGKCIVYSTHDIETAITTSDAMVVLSAEKVHFGKPEKLIAHGIFSTLFPTDEIAFDPKSVKFVFKGL